MKLNHLFAALAFFALPGVAFASKPDPELIGSYLKIQEALASDTTNGIADAAKAVAREATTTKGQDTALFAKIKKSAEALAKMTDLKAARDEFKTLSDAMIAWNKDAKNPGVEVVYCSMAPGYWLQKKGAVMNPYYGKSMLSCGEKK